MNKNNVKIKKKGIKIKNYFISAVELLDMKVINLMNNINEKYNNFDIKRQIRVLTLVMKLSLIIIVALMVFLTPAQIITILPVPEGTEKMKPYVDSNTSVVLVIIGLFLLFTSIYCYHLLNRIHIGSDIDNV